MLHRDYLNVILYGFYVKIEYAFYADSKFQGFLGISVRKYHAASRNIFSQFSELRATRKLVIIRFGCAQGCVNCNLAVIDISVFSRRAQTT